MKQLLLVVTALLTINSAVLAQDAVTCLVGASPFQDSLWVVDTTTLQVTHRVAPNPSSGGSLTGTNGIAKNPNSGTIYTISKQSAVSGRMLGKLNVQTGLVTLIGNLGDNFSSITFRGDSLFGVTGDGATVPETVYLIDTVTAAKTLYRSLGNGADGEVICYNPTDDMIYHWSGNGTIVYEKFSPVNAGDPVINIPILNTTNGETFGSVYMGNNKFYNSNISSGFNRWGANGTVDPNMGNTPDDLRGLVFITCTREILGNDNYCAGGSTLLSVPTAITYQWYKDGVALGGETAATYSATAPGIYNCVVRDVCGTDSVSTGITVQENPLPTVNISGSTSFCTGTPITLTGSSGGTSQWYLNGALISGETTNTISVSAPGVYNMTKTNLNGCTDSAAVGIAVVEFTPPTVTLSAASATACMNGGTIALTESPAGGTFTGSTGNQFDPSTSTPGIDTVIYSYTDGNGCLSSDTVEIEVFAAPSAFIDGVPNQCENGLPVVLNATPSGGTFIPSDIFDPSLVGAGAHTITYMYTDGNGCSDTTTTLILVNSLPTVSAGAAQTDVCVYDGSVALIGTPSGGSFSGNGVTGSTFDPSAANVGINSIDYTYTDGMTGCTNVASVDITVDSCLAINEALLTGIAVYPNPATTELIVDLAGTTDALLSVLDMAGKRVNVTVTTEMNRARLAVANLENGTYWLVVTTAEGQFRQKVVVMH